MARSAALDSGIQTKGVAIPAGGQPSAAQRLTNTRGSLSATASSLGGTTRVGLDRPRVAGIQQTAEGASASHVDGIVDLFSK